MNISRPFITRPVATILLMVAILLVGIVAYRDLPISALPEVNYPTIQVQTLYPGASPEVMSSTVTGPLEKQFGQMQGLSQMTSTSSGGASVIVLQFDLTEDIDVAEQEVQAAINASNSYLPADLPIPPTYSKTNPADAPVLTLALTSKVMPLSEVQDLADTRLAPKISQLTGVGLVTIQGGQKPAVRIQANPTALASYGLTLEDVRTAITGTSVNTAKGTLNGPQQAYTIDANDQLTSAEQYKQVVVAYRNGSAVMLPEVAKITNGVENNKLAAWMNTTPAIILSIQRQSDANTIKVVDSIKALLPQLQASLPASIEVHILTDRTITVRASVEDVEFELLLTIGLVIAVIYVFLRSWRATVIPAVAVPLSLVGTFAAMYALGYSLNNLTLMALTISTGFVVDDAIVMIENISRYLEEGLDPLEASLKGAEEIGFTILSLTVSLIAVLIPLLFMGDITGRLFREFAVTLAVTIIISAVVSLTLTPMMASRLLKHTPPEDETRFYKWSEHQFERIIGFYGRTLQWVLGRQAVVLVIAFSMIVCAGLLYYFIPKGFFPTQDTGIIQAITQAPEATSFDAMSKREQTVAREILEDPAVESIASFIGVDASNTTPNTGRMQINLKALSTRGVSATEVIQRLRPKLNRITGITTYLQPVQDLTVEDRVSRTQYQYTIEDSDSAELKAWSSKLVARLRTLPQLEDVTTDELPNGNAVTVDVDRVTASRLGINPQSLDNTLYDAFGQRQISTLYSQTNQYHVILEADSKFQSSVERLGDIYMQGTGTASNSSSGGGSGGYGQTGTSSSSSTNSQLTASSTSGVSATTSSSSTLATTTANSQLNTSAQNGAISGSTTGSTVLQTSSTTGSTSALSTSSSSGGSSSAQSSTGSAAGGGGGSASSSNSSARYPVPLAAFTTIKKSLTPLTINRQSQFPVITISFNLAPGVHLSQAVNAVTKATAALKMPTNVQTKFQGTAASYETSLNNEGLLVLAALLTVYIVLGVLYESFIHPLTILSTLPSAGVGALLALMLCRMDLGIVGIIGIVLLIGIVKKNGIMMVDFALNAERVEGKPPEEAIYNASLLRFRPIMMTTLAALFGGLPLALGRGIGAELRRPLGVAMVGGLLLSQVLTLYTTPVIYLWFDRISQKLQRRKNDKPIGQQNLPLGGQA
ncbi:cation/multidrug efflux pump [Terriglobus roseus DSM 18391]|uniref:Cation/multidrug efflux pump n=1 Tax=Terriglobus roseus (strain DSM 18391 / NRRL B-41598 / KBS 63) TaxID=926566 RepID=I3ZHG0_TERRK|nr:efflux RND transporter permease subunit [Terriglobus roseus]AFL88335.1 cation/multidrug efflux pump [Terriglobus roseus DSM 18391]AFL88678.1 cation/multidrug efflux pump [Terriglobus roseus DSM 18391]